ncbi:hypothetical protein C8A00DRAFT_13171 [Chaetomidium leptoderma]|uniref:Uncharacterized protein n=1 Tax=Chaetomidium leptoderma TaxID=669021 RepID=A0AAN6ZXN1_9PEZI|nr:hypothetical protein C8A00DRAFT_13171 [Chaetomidium leptoderma]
MSSPTGTTPTTASGFPFSLSAVGTGISAAAANAIDAHLMEIASVRDPFVGDSQSTVLAIVTFPRDDKLSRACDGKPWHDVQLHMNHGKLMSVGSKKIQEMFSPKAQARFRRRLGFEKQLPPGIEYLLDFTPPSEGPELADLTAALWLPRMVKLWFLAGQYIPDPVLETGLGFPTRPLADKSVGAILALGHDDVCNYLGCLSDSSEWQTKEGLPGIVEDNPSPQLSHIPSWRKVEDYCPIRHRVAIIRVLKAINGEGLLLNSAVRMWTVAQVAISLDVPQVVVDPITQWLVAAPNTKFIEICPERAFQLAYGLKIPSVLIAAFRILVNELAIDYASSNPMPGRPQLTWAQRRRDDYGDYPSDPIEYASRAFADRMNDTLRMLQSHTVFGRLPIRIPEWDKLKYYGTLIASTFAPDSPLEATYHTLIAALLSAFQEWINKSLNIKCFSGSFGSRIDDLTEAQRRHYIPAAEYRSLFGLYSDLNPTQRLLTPFFWNRLSLVEPGVDFIATIYRGKPISRHAQNFNLELRRAIADGSIVPDPNHTAIAHPAIAHGVAAFADANMSIADRRLIFDPADFHYALSNAVKQLCVRMGSFRRDSFHSTTYTTATAATTTTGGDGGEPESGIPFFLSDHLTLALDENELNYLPIWADGLDDGSGGVFQDVIPEAEMGPSEPGPGYHTGYTTAGTVTDSERGGWGGTVTSGFERGAAMSIVSMSDLGVGDLSLGGGNNNNNHTTTASMSGGGGGTAGGRSLQVQQSNAAAATNSTADGGGRSSWATPSESFTAADDDESVYADARFAQPAPHQAQGQAIERYVNEADDGGLPGMEYDSDEEMDFGSDDDDGSSTLDGFEEVDAEEAR